MNCTALCSTLSFSSDLSIHNLTCQAYAANDAISVTNNNQLSSSGGCGSSITPSIDICRVTYAITTSQSSQAYSEVWLPQGSDTAWNGRTMNVDNGGYQGCIPLSQMQYMAGMGFATIGDNAGHNSGAFDGSWMLNNNEAIIDWVWRSRHLAVTAGKQVVRQFYGSEHSYAYFIGCSTGGAQGMHSAQAFPGDFDGIIAGSPAADFNHLQDWSGRFVQLTGTGPDDPRFLTYHDWLTVQTAVLQQCDEALDGVPDGILEDPTRCQFDAATVACSNNTFSGCLTDTQIATVNNVFSPLFSDAGDLLFPALLYGSEIDSFRLGQLSGTIQSLSRDWFAYGVYNDTNWNALGLNQQDYINADSLDAYHGYVSSFSGDLSGFRSAGGKLLIYHGMADPLVAGTNSQRYYLKVAQTMNLDNTGLDAFLRVYRISGMAHCGVGKIAGAGAWMFGQTAAADIGREHVIWRMVDWVEKGVPPDTLLGTKFWYDLQDQGVQFVRPHCRFPYRTTYVGGDWTTLEAWNCTFIEDWRACGVGSAPRLCNADGSFT